MDTAILDNRYGVFGLLGSFWPEKMRHESLIRARSLSSITRQVNSFDQFAQVVRNIFGEDYAMMSGIDVPYSANAIGVIGPDVQQRIFTILGTSAGTISYLRRPPPSQYVFQQTDHVQLQTEPTDLVSEVTLQTEFCDYLLFPDPGDSIAVNPMQSDWLRQYIIPIPFGVIPLKIRAITGKDYLNGIDFDCGDGCVAFSQQPDEIFPNRMMHIASGFQKKPNLFSYELGIEPATGDIKAISKLDRYSFSAGSFIKALARACNFVLAPWNDTVVDVSTNGRRVHYEFTNGVLEVDYVHRALLPGDVVSEGDILGSPLAMAGPRNLADTTWWTAINWSAGLSLDSLCPFPGIIAPNTPCRAFGVSQTGPNIHVNITLQGNSASQAKFWYAVKRNELLTGNYLNSVVNLAVLSSIKYVNPVQIMFNYLLAFRGWVITRYQWGNWDGDRQARYQRFLASRMPWESILIINDVNA